MCRTSCLIFLALAAHADTLIKDQPRIKVQPKIERKAWAFDLERVRLLDGPFKRAMDADARYMLSVDVDRLISRYRQFSGLEPKGKEYTGWESATISGHTLGHYLSAASMMYAATGDKRFLDRVNYIVEEIALCQKTKATGFVGGFPTQDKLWTEIAGGIIRTQAFDLNGVWVPWYTTHKLMAGLIDAYLVTGNQKAREILTKLADWTIDLTSKLSDDQMQQMMSTEQGGVLESYTDIYAITGDDKYLALAQRWYHKRFMDPLAEGRDALTGLHINTNIPKVLGAAREYEVTGGDRWHTISATFWENVVRKRSYVMGGAGDDEYFFPPERFADHVTSHAAETCNGYNMLRLTRQLFTWNVSAEAGDYYERAVYNQILASQEPVNGGMVYLCSLKPGHFKVFGTPFDSFWCCTGTGMENHAKYGDSIYFHDDRGLYVNLFVASDLDWREKGLKIRQQTEYPDQPSTRFTFTAAKPAAAAIRIRHPWWAEGALTVSVNGRREAVASKAGEFAVIDRTWKTGDRLDIVFPMKLRVERLPNAPDRIAILYGPVVLAAALGREGMPDSQVAKERLQYDTVLTPDVAVIVATDRDAQSWFKPVPGKPLTFAIARDGLFRTAGTAKTSGFELRPFYAVNDERYNVYWRAFTPEAWAKKEGEFRDEQNRIRSLEARLTDSFRPGEMQPEREHNVQGNRSAPGEYDLRKNRGANGQGSWFSFEMKVDPAQPVELVCTYWGDQQFRNFDIEVDGTKVATRALNRNKPGEFFDVTYPIPPELTKGKAKVTVRFVPVQQAGRGGGGGAGPLFGSLVLRRN
jgi:DUF1680 family protein